MSGVRNHSSGYFKMLALFAVVGLAGCSSHPLRDMRTQNSLTSVVPTESTLEVEEPPLAEPEAINSEGCSKVPEVVGMDPNPPGDIPLEFTSNGMERTYRLGVPESYNQDEPAQLILNLHGAGSDALQASVYSNMPTAATDAGSIIVTPDSTDGFWQVSLDGTDDDFLVGLVEDVISKYCIDLNDVHVMGMSLGAWKATTVGCRYPELFASMALVTEEVRLADCPSMPVVAFHGTADEVVPYGEGSDPGITVEGNNANLPGARNNIASWAEGGGCSHDYETDLIGDDIELWTYLDCDPGVDVQLYTIKGGGHTWPGAEFILSPTTSTIDANEIILEFFADHPNTNRG